MKTLKELLKEDKRVIFGLPNFLTFSRLLILPIVIYFLTRDTRTGDITAFLFMLISAATDYFDGYFARKKNIRSQVGRLIDPLIDKINVGIVMLILAGHKGLPYWYVFMVIGRDIAILAASIYVINKKKLIAESNLLGKWTAATFAIVIILFTLNVPVAKYVFMWISMLLIPTTLILYFISHRDIISKKTEEIIENIAEKMNIE